MKLTPHVLILGASSSLGIDLVNKYACGDYQVTATYANTCISFSHENVAVKKVDLLEADSIHEFVSHVEGIDILIVLPGYLPGKNLQDYSYEEIDTVIDINFTAQVKFIKSILPKLSDESQIIVLSSISGERGSYDPVYAAAKGAMIPFAKSLATWLAPKTRVNVVTPSLIEDSKMFYDMSPERRDYHRENSPTGKLLAKNDLASILFDITLPHWSQLNGEVIRVNGGSYV